MINDLVNDDEWNIESLINDWLVMGHKTLQDTKTGPKHNVSQQVAV